MLKWMKSFQADYEDEYEEEEEYETEAPQPAIPRLGTPQPQASSKLVSISSQQGFKRQELLSITMADYSSTGEIASYIKSKKPIIVNMQKLDEREVQRALDYLSGVSYALDGTVELVAQNIYVMVPDHIELNKE
ncbi:MAG: hypothetical protein ATN35_05060 [Epulopiscium sp. Nele67-Bin004]|nr:MAG: hypothetical protein ATN35_05060 [Epulopiscium sp. Nele67-Bin004]